MRADLKRVFTGARDVVTDVPGWPDAPVSARIKRSLPILVPILATAAVLIAQATVIEPERDVFRSTHRDLVQLREESIQMRTAYSVEKTQELKAEAKALEGSVLATPDEARAWLSGLTKKIGEHGWRASFQSYDSGLKANDEDGPIGFVPALARLAPVTDNENRIQSLLLSIEELSQSAKRIDLTRVAVRADEPGKPVVEINLRVAHLLSNEKAPQ